MKDDKGTSKSGKKVTKKSEEKVTKTTTGRTGVKRTSTKTSSKASEKRLTPKDVKTTKGVESVSLSVPNKDGGESKDVMNINVNISLNGEEKKTKKRANTAPKKKTKKKEEVKPQKGKRRSTLLLILLLLLLLLLFFVVGTYFKFKDVDDDKPKNDDQTIIDPLYKISEDGEYIYFGAYPQTIKAENVTITSSSPDSDGYYLGSDGERYAKVAFDYTESFADLSTITWESAEQYKMNVVSDGTAMQKGQDYYFKVEPLKWRILESKDGTVLLVCDSILECMAYQSNYFQSGADYFVKDENSADNILTVEGTQIYANNYKYSELRDFLTDDFYNISFSAEEKQIIKLSDVNNSEDTTKTNASHENPYACENTSDYVFALSYKDLQNSDYGFIPNDYTVSSARVWKTTDYAKATNALTFTSEYLTDIYGLDLTEGGTDYTNWNKWIGCGSMWLRSPYLYSSGVSNISVNPPFGDKDAYVPNGVVPALYLSVDKTTPEETRSTYTISFDGNDATSGDMGDISNINLDDSTTLTANTYEKIGYTFLGWSTDPNANSATYFDGAIVSALATVDNATVTLYAIWSPNTNTPFAIQYYLENINDSNYELDATRNVASTGVTGGAIDFSSYLISIENYTFSYADPVTTNIAGDGSTVVKLYYTRNRNTLSISGDSGISNVSVTGNGVAETNGGYTVKNGTTVTITASLVDGYAFAGWTGYSVADATAISTTFVMPNEAVTLSATTSAETYTITFSGNATDDTITISSTSANVTYATAIGTLPTATRTGYEFEGWFVETSGTTQFTATTELNSTNFVTIDHTNKTLTVYAKWTACTYGEWQYDEDEHWKVCSNCNTETAHVAHTFKNGICDVCEYEREELAFSYDGDTNSYTVTGIGRITGTDIVIPATYDDGTHGSYPVKSVNENAFQFNSNITSVVFSENMEMIGDGAFTGCESLTSVTLSSTIKEIGTWAFAMTGITSINIPASVETIGDNPFMMCEDLTTITVNTANTKFHVNNSCLIDTVNKKIITGLSYSNIPSNSEEVTMIGYSAFWGISSGIALKIPSNITTIDKLAFKDCASIVSVELPVSITIKEQAFSDCTSLTTIYYAGGSQTEWSNNVTLAAYNSSLTNSTRYYYSETEPTTTGKYWHYVDSVPTPWAEKMTYKVEHYTEKNIGGYKLETTDNNLVGTIGGTVTATAKTFDHYTHDADNSRAVESGTVASDGSLVLKVYYYRNSYILTLNKGENIVSVSATGAYEYSITNIGNGQYSVKHGEPVRLIATADAGYRLSGWTGCDSINSSNILTMPTESITVTANAIARTDTAYKIEHWLEDLDGTYDGPVSGDTEYGTGTTGALVTATPKTDYRGWEHTTVEGESLESANILGDGSLTLKVYYKRHTDTLTIIKQPGIASLTVTGVGLEPISGTTDQYTIKYQTEITLSATASAGYIFDGWLKYGNGSPVSNNTYFHQVLNDVSITAKAIGKTYALTFSGNVTDDTTTITPESKNVTYGSNIGDLATATRTGFTFAGWYKETGYTNQISTITVVNDTNFAVNHETQTISIYAKWSENKYTIAFDGNGGTGEMESLADINYTESKTLTTNGFEKAGYTFIGWSKTQTSTTAEYTNSVTKLSAEDGDTVTLYAIWTADTNTGYTVNHYKQKLGNWKTTGLTAEDCDVETETGAGETNTQVTPSTKSYDGFTAPSTQTVTIAGDGSTVVNYFYLRNSYDLTLSAGTGISITASGTGYDSEEHKAQFGAYITLNKTVSDGYTFGAYSSSDVTISNGTFTMPAKAVTITATATANANTAYSVEYYLQNLAGNDYIKDTTKTVNTTGTTDTAIDFNTYKTAIAGFEFDHSDQPSATINGNGNTVVKLYYTRKSFTLTLTKGTNVDTISATGTYVTANTDNYTVKYGATVTLSATASAGYTFSSWTGYSVTDNSFTMPAENVTLTANATANTNTAYTVEYHLQNLTNDEYTKDDDKTVNATGTTETAINLDTYKVSITGFTFASADPTSATISSNGNTLVKLYYTRNSYTLTLTKGAGIATVSASGTGVTENSGTYTIKYGAEVTLSATADAGYSFSWSGYTFTGSTLTMPAENVTLTATTTANTYSLTYNTNGGSEIDAITKTYNTAFTSTELPTNLTKTGYTFDGWYNDSSFTTKVEADDLFTTATATFANVATASTTATIFAKWDANTDTEYKVEYYLQNIADDNYTKDETKTETKTGTTGETATITDKYISGFSYDSDNSLNVTSGTIAGDGSLVLKLYYKRRVGQLFITKGTGIESATATGDSVSKINETSTQVSYNVRYGAEVTLSATASDGYTFSGWTVATGNTATITDNKLIQNTASAISITANATANTNTAYSVEYYLQNLADNDYIKDTTKTVNTTGTTDTAIDFNTYKTAIAGFEFDHSDQPSATINGNGNTVVKLYYTRKSFTLTLTKGTNVDTISATGTYVTANTDNYTVKYGASVTLSATANAGYTFSSWTGYSVTDNSFTMPAENVTLTANATANTNTAYKVEHYQEELAGGTYTLADTDNLTGTTGVTVTATAKTDYDYFTHDTTNTNRVESGTIAGDGSLVLKVYYKRKTGTLLIGKDTGIDTVSASGTGVTDTTGSASYTSYRVKYGAIVTLTATASTGYTLAGWEKGSETLSGNTYTHNALEIMVTAKATVNSYSLTYDTNGGGTITAVTKAYNTAFTSTELPTNLTKTGYTFDGWYNDSSFTTKVEADDLFTTATATFANVATASTTATIYAKWTEYTYTISFDGNGETSGTMESLTNVGYSEKKTLTANSFSRTGYTFLGWATSSTATTVTYANKQQVSKLVSTNGGTLTLYALWNPKKNTAYSVEYYLQNLADNDYTKDTTKTVSATGTTDTSIDIDSYEVSIAGFTFDHSDPTSATIAGSGNTIVKLYYTRNSYTLTLNTCTGVTTVSASGTGVTSETSGYSVKFGANVTLSATTSDAYTFDVWTEANNKVQISGNTYSHNVAENLTITPNAIETTSLYVVTFNLNVDDATTITLSQTTKNATNGEAIGTLPTPTSTDYQFLGWFKESGCTNQITATTVLNETNFVLNLTEHTTTIYAKFVACTYGTTWTTNETAHWHECSACGNKKDYAEHTFLSGVCSVCEYEREELEFDYRQNIYGDYSYAYFVTGIGRVTSSDIVIPETYDDGVHGEKPVVGISYNAFSGNKTITSVTIPTSMIHFGDEAFYNCTNLTAVYISDLSAWLKTSCLIVYGNPLYWAHDLYLNGTKLTSITIPNDVTEIGPCALAGASITSVTIPNHVTKINERAFTESYITEIVIPSSITEIDNQIFSECKSLTTVTMPSTITKIKGGAFADCTALTTVNISDLSAFLNIEFAGGESNPIYNTKANLYLNGEKITDLVVPSDVTEIKKYAMYNYRQLTSVTIHSGVTSIGESAFEKCSALESITFETGSELTTIGKSAFAYTAITSISIPSGVTSIANRLFYSCSSLENVTFEGDVTTLGQEIFDHCLDLLTIVIPATVTKVSTTSDKETFSVRTSPLIVIFFEGTQEQWDALGVTTVTGTRTVCIYSETEPTSTTGYYWHYVDGTPTVWRSTT